jgi:Na+/H+-dicarboxylate symporter
MDSFGTAGNVTGDGAIALIIHTIKNKENTGGDTETSTVPA